MCFFESSIKIGVQPILGIVVCACFFFGGCKKLGR